MDNDTLVRVIEWLDSKPGSNSKAAAAELRRCLPKDHPMYCSVRTAPNTRRDPTAECPDCKNVYLYTNFYDKCYQCGRNIH